METKSEHFPNAVPGFPGLGLVLLAGEHEAGGPSPLQGSCTLPVAQLEPRRAQGGLGTGCRWRACYVTPAPLGEATC